MKNYRMLLILPLWYILSVPLVFSQNSDSGSSSELERLFSRLLVVSDDSVRLRINDSVEVIIDRYVKSDSVFSHNFKNVRFLGQITSPDSVIKIINWNLYLRNQPGKYNTYIIKKNINGKSNTVHNLKTLYRTEVIKSDTVYGKDNWYGALYYGIRPQIINGVKCWILLGIDYGNPEITRKIIDILYFGSDEKIIFGMKSFEAEKELRYRAVFEYSSEATMTLRFEGDDSIIFDHLVPFSPELVNQRQYYGPQYTYDAYVLEGGIWKFKSNIDARNKDKEITGYQK